MLMFYIGSAWGSQTNRQDLSGLDSTLISVEFENADLKEALNTLMSQTDRQIVYKDALVKDKQVTHEFKKQSLSEVLYSLLNNFSLSFEVLSSGQIVVLKKKITNKTVKGFILDSSSRSPLPAANVMIKGSALGTTSDQDGFFELADIPPDKNDLLVQYIGYEPEERSIEPVAKSKTMRIFLRKRILEGQGVRVESTRDLLNLESATQPTRLTLSPARLKQFSALGEHNIFHAISMTPGVSSINDGVSGLRVRGESDNQNLVLLDGIPLYQTDHFFGLVSSLNLENINSVQFYRGGFPAKYGGRTSSVLVLNGSAPKISNNKISIGINQMNLTAAFFHNWGENVAFSFAGRRSYSEYMDNAFYNKLQNYITHLDTTQKNGENQNKRSPETPGLDLNYYDVNSKLSYRPTNNDMISLNYYQGQDYMDQSFITAEPKSPRNPRPKTEYTDISKWGNIGASGIWLHHFENHDITTIELAVSNYFSTSKRGWAEPLALEIINNSENRIETVSFKFDNESTRLPHLTVNYGIDLKQNTVQFYNSASNRFDIKTIDETAVTSAAYLETVMKPAKTLTLTTGFRLNRYSLIDAWYPEPRLTSVWKFYKQFCFSATYSHHYQFIDRIADDNVIYSQQQYWILADKSMNPGFAEHMIAGLRWENDTYLLSAESYYKDLDHVKIGSERYPDDIIDLESAVQRTINLGSGEAKGLELLAMKKNNSFRGWLSYTLSGVNYTVPEINNGKAFAADFDRRHEFKTVALKDYKGWQFGLTWLYTTGARYTPVSVVKAPRRNGNANLRYKKGGRNSAILPNYHRLDLSVTKEVSFRSFNVDFGLSIYNVYDAELTIKRSFIKNGNELQIRDTKMLGILPALTLKISR